MTDGVHLTYAGGKIRAFQADGTEILGIRHASIELQQDGLTEVALYFGIKTAAFHEVHRASDGVRETR